MKKANCGASMKPAQKSTPKMAEGGMMSAKLGQQGSRQMRGGGNGAQRGPVQSVQAMTAMPDSMKRRKRY